MKNNCFAYIKINEVDNKVTTSGVKFREFMEGIIEKPKNLLMFKGWSINSNIETNLGLEYVDNENIPAICEEEVYDFGDFQWIDFEEKNNLNKIDKAELAKMLYLNHTGKPYDTFLFESLNNKYTYIAHDDEYIVNVYMKNIKDYKNVINYKIKKELKGRKRFIADIPNEILDIIYALCKKGVVIDFEEAYSTGVSIYPIGDVKYIDDAHDKLDRYRNRRFSSEVINLDYDNNKKLWSIYK